MFAAYVLICAIENGITNKDNCVRFDDNWGPYATREECNVRLEVMEESVKIPAIAIQVWQSLGHPQKTEFAGFCEASGQDV
jgi:hypothetical protein